MVKPLENLADGQRRRFLVEAAKRGAHDAGYHLSRVPGRGLSNVWNIEKDGRTIRAAIRTTRDRWIAFPPFDGGTRWRTLSDVEAVIVAAVDDKDEPRHVQVYIFPAAAVRERFDAAYAARTRAGHVQKDGFGMWVGIDHDPRGIAASVGSGIVEKFRPIAVYSVASLLAADAGQEGSQVADAAADADDVEPPQAPRLATIGEVMSWARGRIAELAGVRPEAVKLDLKVEY